MMPKDKNSEPLPRSSSFIITEFALLTLAGAIGSGLGGWLLDAFAGFTLQDLILLMGALMLSFGVYWFINGVWGVKKLAAPVVVE